MVVKVVRYFVRIFSRLRFRAVGKGVVFDPLNSYFSYGRLCVGNNVFIGGRAWFSATHSYIRIGSNVMFGPNVSIFAGNHKFGEVGVPMIKQHKSAEHSDPDVIIGDDVWVGGGATILGGVVIGEGAIIGAGAVVTRAVPAYSICAGNPARVIGARFSESDKDRHISILYPDRLS